MIYFNFGKDYSKKYVCIVLSVLLFLMSGVMSGCGKTDAGETNSAFSADIVSDISEQSMETKPEPSLPKDENSEEKTMDSKLTFAVNGEEISVEWADNESVKALKKLAQNEPITIQMSKYGGFEQVGSIGASLPKNDIQTITEPGDIMLYSGDQIVVFYGSNSWSYTRLGKIQGRSSDELTEILGKNDVTITISTAETSEMRYAVSDVKL